MKPENKQLSPEHTKGRHFIAMNSMLKCVSLYIDFFNHESSTAKRPKFLISRLQGSINYFQKEFEKLMPEQLKSLWRQDLEEKDFTSISRVLDYWVEMSNEERESLELVCESIKNGTFKVELEDGN